MKEGDSSRNQRLRSELFGSYKAEWLKERIFDLFTEPSYFPELAAASPSVLLGGRGTGKTTVLRCMSYEGRFALAKNDPQSIDGGTLSFIIIDPAGMVPLVALRRTKKPGSARAGTCRDHAINGPRSWTTQSRGTPAIDAQRLNWLRRRRAIRSGGGAHPLAATRRLLRSVMVGA